MPPPAASPPPPTQAAVTPLTIEDFAFHPSTMTVAAGTTVRATNKDEVTHTWTSDTGIWDSGSLGQGESYSFTFRTPGTYTFHCSPHPTMTGSVVVR